MAPMDFGRNSNRLANPPITVLTSGHQHSLTVSAAFAAGAGVKPMMVRDRYRPDGPVAMYGRLRGLGGPLKFARSRGFAWVYMDRGYFGATHGNDYRGYFRATVNALQHSGRGEADNARLHRLRVHIRPWRQSGDHVLVCPPGDVFAALEGFSATDWLRNILSVLESATDRPIRIRNKPQKHGETTRPLRADFENCWAVVTHSSNSAVEALMGGIPVFCTGPCPSQAMGLADVSLIESPHLPDDREHFAAVLAANQWTLDEMKAGVTWAALREQVAKGG